MPKRTIAILEDDARRIAAMREVLAAGFADFPLLLLWDAPKLIAWLRLHLAEVALLSLDNDLIDPNEVSVDLGEGRDVADYLAGVTPAFPVILHTSNTGAAFTMSETLRERGWHVSRVAPTGDVEWIHGPWARRLGQLIAPDTPSSSSPGDGRA